MDLREKILSTRLCEGQIALFYLGQESILVKYREKYLLFDGYLSDYVDRHCCTEQVVWRRRYPAPITGGELDFVDAVFCSHAHFDHADPDTLGAIARVNKKAVYIVPAPIAETVAGYGVPRERLIAAKADEPIEWEGLSILPVPAAHEELAPNAAGEYDTLGYRLTLGETVFFHAGDCCVYTGLAERLGHVDVMCLPVNGRSYYKKMVEDIIGNMNAAEAARLCAIVGARLMVPMHFDLYDVNCVSAASVVEAFFAENNATGIHLFRPGERYVYGA